MGIMDQTLKSHEQLIEKHEYKLEDIQQDLIDIKTRLGIKDLTNGQVVDYQKRLVQVINEEKAERKEQDTVLREDIKKIDDKTWYIVTGIILVVVLEIGLFLVQMQLGGK